MTLLPNHLGDQWKKVSGMSPYQKGTLGQVGAKPGLGRKVFGTPSARQAAANKGLHSQSETSTGRSQVRPAGSANDMAGTLDHALEGTPVGRAVGWGDKTERGPRLQDTAARQWFRK